MAKMLGRSAKPQKLTKSNAPVKRSLNLAHAGEKKSRIGIGLIVTVLLIIGAATLSKFAIVDRLMEVDQARAEVAAVQRKIDEGNREIDAFGELADKYAHYTYSGMTETELSRADRVKVLDMLNRLVLPHNYVESWTLSDNVLTLNISGNTLQELNLVTQLLEKDELVDYCTVTTAATSTLDSRIDNRIWDSIGDVTAQIVIHLKKTEEVHW